MAEMLLYVGIGALLIVTATTLVVATLILRNARRSVDLAEDRMKYLREEQARLAYLREERGSLKEELRQEREQHLEAERRAERFRQERLLLRQDQEQLVEELEQEHESYLEAHRRAERLGQEQLLLEQERNQLMEDLKREREQHLENQRRAERLSQECLLLEQERNQLMEDLKREREQHLEDQRRAERLNQECLLLRQDQGHLAEDLEQERAKHLEAEQRAWQEQEGWERERRVRRDAERRAGQSERELEEIQVVQRDRKVQQENSIHVLGGLSEDLLAERTQRPASFPRSGIPETTASKPAEGPPEAKRPRLGMWHPHPDDDAVSRGKPQAGRARTQSDAPLKTDHKHYDKYLENYQGYVELAEKLCQTRDNGEVPSGSPAEREWEKRMRRVNDGIERTTARLDILEEYNPELATDDRISHRASIARRQSKLGK
jgi:DNA repair exonuclease SbcCD ATPase subunit